MTEMDDETEWGISHELPQLWRSTSKPTPQWDVGDLKAESDDGPHAIMSLTNLSNLLCISKKTSAWMKVAPNSS